MIKLNYSHLNDSDFNSALGVIDVCPSLAVKTLCAFNKLKKAVDKEHVSAKELFTKVLDKYTVMETVGEGDKIVTQPKMQTVAGGSRRFLTDEAAMDAELKTLMTEEFEVGIAPLTLTELAPANLSPRQTRALGPVLVSDEEIQAGPKLVSK